jgi:RNA polymerase-binding transcription factor
METDHEKVMDTAEATLDAVDAALDRLTQGSYGKCADCGEPIPDERLEALPTVTTCERHGT